MIVILTIYRFKATQNIYRDFLCFRLSNFCLLFAITHIRNSGYSRARETPISVICYARNSWGTPSCDQRTKRLKPRIHGFCCRWTMISNSVWIVKRVVRAGQCSSLDIASKTRHQTVPFDICSFWAFQSLCRRDRDSYKHNSFTFSPVCIIIDKIIRIC